MAFAHDSIKPFRKGGSKKEQVNEMFDEIAPKYDFMNRFLSAGTDRGWRKKAIRRFVADKPRLILDVATGTADMALMASGILPGTSITGIDISEKMLEVGREKIAIKGKEGQIELLQMDAETINFPDSTFDGVMVAFGVRNFENLERGLSEILRVLKPGSQLIVLEFSKPAIPGVKNLYNLYMGTIAPALAGLFKQNKKAYKYLNESAKAFPERKVFDEILKKTGYTATSWKPLSLGICCIYSGRKAV